MSGEQSLCEAPKTTSGDNGSGQSGLIGGPRLTTAPGKQSGAAQAARRGCLLLAPIIVGKAMLGKKSEARRHSEVEQAEAVVAERFFSWKMLENGSRPEEIAMARADRRRAESELGMLEHGYRLEEIAQAKARRFHSVKA